MHQIHHVEDEQWLGGLLHANDELVHALMSFEQLDRSIDADSDSDDELAEQAHLYRSKSPLGGSVSSTSADLSTVAQMRGMESMANAPSPTSTHPPDLAGLSLESAPKPAAAPPRPPPMAKPAQPQRPEPEDDEDDEDDPFADKNVVETPALERGEPRWS